jgi:hypothetical protein
MISMTEFSIWFRNIYLEWEKQQPEAGLKGVVHFALEIPAPQSMVSEWINGVSEPGPKYQPILAARYGNIVYEKQGKPRPKDNIYDFPAGFRNRLEHAIREANEALEKHGLKGDSPEGEKTVTEIFDKEFKRTEK